MSPKIALRGLLAAFVLALAMPATAEQLAGADRQQVLDRIEGRINAIDTMQARFLQVASNGGQATGTLFLQRPGKMRVQYDPPVDVQVVATGQMLIHYDGELGEVSHLPLASSPASVLLGDRLRFGEDAKVLGVERNGPDVAVTVADKDGANEVTLIFREADELALERWRVLDAQGAVTEVQLIDPRFDVPLDPVIFQFVDPSPDRNKNRR